MWVSPHFQLSEFACHCGCKGENQINIFENIKKTAMMLERYRIVCGAKPMTVTSGYRCKKHNADPKVGGEPNSFHLDGRAADVTVKGMDAHEVQEATIKQETHNGIGRYDDFTHFDCGPKRVFDRRTK